MTFHSPPQVRGTKVDLLGEREAVPAVPLNLVCVGSPLDHGCLFVLNAFALALYLARVLEQFCSWMICFCVCALYHVLNEVWFIYFRAWNSSAQWYPDHAHDAGRLKLRLVYLGVHTAVA